MFTARADTDALVFDDISDSETIAGGRSEAEMSEGRVAAVGCREDGVVQLVPAAVGEEERHAVMLTS